MTDPGELLEKFTALFKAGREGRMKILQEDDRLSDYSRVVGRIEKRLHDGRATDEDVEQLRQIAREFRAEKEREKAA